MPALTDYDLTVAEGWNWCLSALLLLILHKVGEGCVAVNDMKNSLRADAAATLL